MERAARWGVRGLCRPRSPFYFTFPGGTTTPLGCPLSIVQIFQKSRLFLFTFFLSFIHRICYFILVRTNSSLSLRLAKKCRFILIHLKGEICMDKEPGIYFVMDNSLDEVHRTFYKLFEYLLGLEMLLQNRTKVCSLDLNSDHNHLLFSIAGLLCYTRNELMHTNYYRSIYQEDHNG